MDILEFEILTHNLTETEKFYSELLDLRVADKGPGSVSFFAGQTKLKFIETRESDPTYHFAFNIPHNKLEEAIKWLSSKLELIRNHDDEIVTDFKNWNAKSVYFYDNNKNILEFIARYDLHNTSDQPFNGASIQSISEAGIVTEEPLAFAEQLIKDYKVPFYIKGPKREDFVVLGDEQGLFIVVKTKRNWYPTSIPAGRYFSRIRFNTGHSTDEITLQ